MPSIEIDCALTNSQVPATGFMAAGTWENGGTTPSQISCTLTPTSGGGSVLNFTIVPDDDGIWAGPSPALNAGSTYALAASFPGAAADTETNIRVLANGDSRSRIDAVIPVVPFVALAPPAAAPANTKQFAVSGHYRKGAKGTGGVCLAVIRNGKKFRSVIGAEAFDLPAASGTWSVTLTLDAAKVPGGGQKLAFFAVIIDEDGAVAARFGRHGPRG